MDYFNINDKYNEFMKKFILFTLLAIFMATVAYSQNCDGDIIAPKPGTPPVNVGGNGVYLTSALSGFHDPTGRD